jgi:hypothetical protein
MPLTNCCSRSVGAIVMGQSVRETEALYYKSISIARESVKKTYHGTNE